METRNIEQIKVYKLLLNPVTANFEKANIVAIAYDRGELEQWYESLKVDVYIETPYYKNFKKGSVLENYNPFDGIYSEHCGIREEWTTQQNIDEYIARAEASFGFIEVPSLVVGS